METAANYGVNAFEYEEEVQEDRLNAFEITDDRSASWVFRRLKAVNEKIAGVDRLAGSEIERIKMWKEKEKARFENDKAYFEGLITKYVDVKSREDSKFKLSTPWGSAKVKKQRDGIEYEDEKVIGWLKANDREDLIRVKEEIMKTELKKAYKEQGEYLITEDGEIVDGVRIVKRPDVIDIKVE